MVEAAGVEPASTAAKIRVIHRLSLFFLKQTKINGKTTTLTVIGVPPRRGPISALFFSLEPPT